MPDERRVWWMMGSILLAHWALLLGGLAQQSGWIDEWFTLQDIGPGWRELLPQIIATERRPPLYWVLLKCWASLAGQGEFALRLASAAASLTVVALTFALARSVDGRRTGVIAAGLTGLSPFLVLYGRMLRSYPLFACLAVAATWALVNLAARPTRGRWLAYVGLAAALLYTDYGALAVLGVHALWMLKGLPRDARVRGLGAGAVALAAFVPWMGVLLSHSTGGVLEADLARGWLGLALKLVVPFASLGAGETVYPWHPLATLSIATCFALAGLGLSRHLKRRSAYAWLLAAWLALPLVFTAAVLSTAAADITFLNMASRTPHLVSSYSVLVAAGIAGIEAIRRRMIVGGIIGATFAVALLHYYTGREFYNPIYTVPTRQVVAQVEAAAAPEDLIVADSDTLFGYYYRAQPGPAAYEDTDPPVNRAAIEARRPRRVWLIAFGRDRTAGAMGTDELVEWLRLDYTEHLVQGYGRVGPTYVWVKERLLHRPTYLYKLTVSMYERKP